MEEADSHSTFSLSSLLLCDETDCCFVERDNYVDKYALRAEDDEEYVEMLFRREVKSCKFHRRQPSSAIISDWIQCARLEAITWILNTKALFGFGFQTAYLSVTYFDRFLSGRIIDGGKYWAIKLLAVACLSLAAKMEECKVPALSEFPVEDYNFDSRVIQRMELLVLNTLEWRLRSVTPFAYLNHFLSKLCQDDQVPMSIVSRTIELILATLTEAEFLDCRPSVIAGAAVLLAMEKKLPRLALELKINALAPTSFLKTEDVVSCYNRMQEVDVEKFETAKYPKSPDMSPIHPRGDDVFEISSATSGRVTHRKRLIFNGCDQNYGMHGDKRHK